MDITSPWGIAWVTALFEGPISFMMIGVVMKSMDPSPEEASQVMGAVRLRTVLKITLPLVAPGVLSAAIFVFAEMLGSFPAALVLGTPARFYVITTAIYQLVSKYPPRMPLAAAMDVGRLRWVLLAICVWYVVLSVILPVATLLFASVQKLAVAFPTAANFTLDNFRTAISMNAVRSAMANSLMLGLLTATIGVVVTGLLSWLIQCSRLPGRGVLEYIVMFPQAVPRLVYAFGMMSAWVVFPIPIYGTFWSLDLLRKSGGFPMKQGGPYDATEAVYERI